jgi:GTPase SAR1 family protein
MKDADAILLCYSLNDANSLKGIEFWLEELNRQKVDLNQSVFAVVGCKKDLDINAPTDAVLDLLKSRVFLHFDTSAKTAEGVDEMMKAVIEESAMRKMRKLEGELK